MTNLICLSCSLLTQLPSAILDSSTLNRLGTSLWPLVPRPILSDKFLSTCLPAARDSAFRTAVIRAINHVYSWRKTRTIVRKGWRVRLFGLEFVCTKVLLVCTNYDLSQSVSRTDSHSWNYRSFVRLFIVTLLVNGNLELHFVQKCLSMYRENKNLRKSKPIYIGSMV